MIDGLMRLAQPFLLSLDPEVAHNLSIRALETGLRPCSPLRQDAVLRQQFWGLDFPNPLGVAAGFDKNAAVPDALLRLGFGFTEVGTLTPRPQSGNPKPRVFRLPADQAVINRLGFNNDGHGAGLARLERRRKTGIVGVNIGANKDSQDRIADYVAGIRAFARCASYFTVNISSPNTPGLRDLQHEAALNELLAAVMAARTEAAPDIPVLLKVAPDIGTLDIEAIARAVAAHQVDGLIVSNTTLSRHGALGPQAHENGGLSGRPLFERATIILARMRLAVGPDLPIIGVGGIHSAETAYEKLRAGANLMQLYTGLIYGGIGLADDILIGLARRLRRDGHGTIGDITGIGASDWAERTLPEDE